MLLAKVKETIKKHRMLDPGDRVVVAVSGGPDSVCLLSVLKDLAAEWNLILHVAHLDHMFRGEESAAEARFVREFADRLGIPSTVEQHDVPRYCRERGLSPQAGAREVRYAFLDRVADASGARKIALGHTASDQAETFLLRLLRGAGVSGLSGIPPKRERYIRPLIDAQRDEVLDYLRERGLTFMTDPTNLEPVYTRNRIRLLLMPALRAFNPRIEETLAAEAGILRDEDEAMEARCTELAAGILLHADGAVRIGRDAFNSLGAALRRRLLRKAVETARGNEPFELSASQADAAIEFLESAQTGRSLALPGGLRLLREYDAVIAGPPEEPPSYRVPLSVPGITAVPVLLMEVETEFRGPGAVPSGSPSRGDKNHENSLWQAAFDYDKIALPLFIRGRQNGDRFCPAGMKGKSRKLQDYFTDKKVPQRKRGIVPILATEQDIVWVVGMRTDERFLPGPETKRLLLVTVRNRKTSCDNEARVGDR